jgi:hypothetical protein
LVCQLYALAILILTSVNVALRISEARYGAVLAVIVFNSMQGVAFFVYGIWIVVLLRKKKPGAVLEVFKVANFPYVRSLV